LGGVSLTDQSAQDRRRGQIEANGMDRAEQIHAVDPPADEA
jgi:hypothetical protein